MCDYSLEAYKNVPAALGETYTLFRFPSGTKGFVKEGDTECAVCIRAGSALTLITPDGREMTAVFGKINDWGYCHKDAVWYMDGARETLQILKVGTKARVEYVAPEDVVLGGGSLPEAFATQGDHSVEAYFD
jgi:hypothetical protein